MAINIPMPTLTSPSTVRIPSVSYYVPPQITDRELTFEFGRNFEASKVAPLEWGQDLSDAFVTAAESSADYREFSARMLDELERNTDIAKAYTREFHKRRAQNERYSSEYQLQDDGTYKYIGPENEIFNADGSFKPNGWFRARTDGKYGLIHESGFKKTPTPQPPEPVVPPVGPPPIPPEDTPLTPEGNPNNPFPKNPTAPIAPFKRSIWTDWIPALSEYFTNKRANRRDAEEQKKMKFPLYMPKEKHAIKTDAYLQRQLLEKQKQEVLTRAGQQQTSNADLNTAIWNQAEGVVDKYSDRQAQLQSAEYQKTSDDVVKAANYNTAQRVDTANLNLKSLAASHNNIINANRRQIAKDAANFNSLVDSLYTDYGKWKHDQRLSDLRRKMNLAEGDLRLQDAELSKIKAEQTDPSRWSQLSNFAVALTQNPEGFTEEEKNLLNKYPNPEVGLQSDPSYRNLIISRLQTGQDAVSVRWRAAWEEQKNIRLEQYNAARQNLWSNYHRQTADKDAIIDNQIFDYVPGGRRSSLMSYKDGGKLKLLREIANNNQKAKKQHDENFREAQKRAQKELRAQLDALDEEQLFLLKAAFK